LPGGFEFALQAVGAIAASASPGLGAVLIAATSAVVGVLYTGEFEVLFPVRTFFNNGVGQ